MHMFTAHGEHSWVELRYGPDSDAVASGETHELYYVFKDGDLIEGLSEENLLRTNALLSDGNGNKMGTISKFVGDTKNKRFNIDRDNYELKDGETKVVLKRTYGKWANAIHVVEG